MRKSAVVLIALLGLTILRQTLAEENVSVKPTKADGVWPQIAPFFSPPPKFKDDLGAYRPVLKFDDGRPVRSAADWPSRRQEILRFWHDTLGPWPPLVAKPSIEYLEKSHAENFTRCKVRIEVAPQRTQDAYLLLPDGKGPLPAVLVVFYDAETGAGLKEDKKEALGFGYHLAKRGFVALSIGDPGALAPSYNEKLQPLSYLAYCAANCRNLLANLPEVDPKRIGIVGHSFGGKWAMFASCLDDRFACACWCDPGIVWNEKDPNANYWEPWYLGLEAGAKRGRGIPTDRNPRTGPYKRLVETGHDLHELHALMAPRPFLVSGGEQDPLSHWPALNHTIAVNKLLGYSDRVAMTSRSGHTPTAESNQQIYQFFEHFLKAGRP